MLDKRKSGKPDNEKINNNSQSQSSRLVTIVEESDVELFHDDHKNPYARIKKNDYFACYKVRSRDFKRWLSNKYWNLFRQAANTESINSALNIIEAKACHDGMQYILENRIAYTNGELFYDLGNWKAIKIDISGWEILDYPPILFSKYAHQQEQVTPVIDSERKHKYVLDDLLCLLNIEDRKQQLLFIIALHSLYLPHIPKPIFVLHGGQGTAKTTTSTLIKELVDPSKLKTLRIGNNPAEFIQQASHHYLLCLDNLTTLPPWMSDTLCQIVTGAGFSKRELYTNDEDVIYSFKRALSLNGINLVPSKPDLLDRCLIFELEPIAKNDRIDEEVFWDEFNEMKPKLIGSIFSVLSRAIKIKPNIRLHSKPRMADFAQWGAAISEALGYTKEEFIEAYNANIAIQHIEAVESNPAAKVLLKFIEDRSEWHGSATELYNEFEDIAELLMVDKRNGRYPRDPNWLYRRIVEVKPNLESLGVFVEKDETNRSDGRIISIKTDPKLFILDNHRRNADNVVKDTSNQHDSIDSNFMDMSEEELIEDLKNSLDEMNENEEDED